MTQAPPGTGLLGAPPEEETLTVARNVSTRYLAIVAEMVVGLLVLPFNLAHLGAAAYGLWMLTASVTVYFSVLDLGFSNGLVKFVAQYRARRDAQALNEILSTIFFVFTTLAVITYLIAAAVALNLGTLFSLTPAQVELGRAVLLIISVHVATGLAFGVFGGVINGFQRYDLNNLVGMASTLVTAAVNVAVLLAGYGLIELVAATTIVRVLTYWAYRANAYRVFPGLHVRASLVRKARLREIAPFSFHMFVIDWANKLNYSVDVLLIGALLNTTAVAVWTVAQRLTDAALRLTNQLSQVLFPTVVDNEAASRRDRLRAILVVGTRLSLAMILPIGGTLILMAGPLVRAWVGSNFADSVLILQVLTLGVIARVGAATASTVLKGTDRHQLVAGTNVATAVVNLSLSVALIGPYGLTGVAVGTLVPVTLGSILVIFPTGCRQVDLPLVRAWREAVWPALWPVAVMTAFVLLLRPYVADGSLVVVGALMVASAAVYALTFMALAVTAAERRLFAERAQQLLAWRRPLAARATSEVG
ncbi:MAG: oligosaccharide flippase family protein [Vicinamibacterales bacterium]